jgi:hypothetical protein
MRNEHVWSRTARLALLVAGLSLAVIATVIAESRPSAKLSGWELTAFEYFRNDKYPEAMRVLDAHKGDRFAKILSTFVHLQEWVYSKNKQQEALWTGEFKVLANSVGVKDISDLVLIAEQKDKPQSVKRAKQLLKRAFKNIFKNEDVPELVEYLASSEKDVCKFAVDTVNRILKIRRKVVNDGGSLREQDIKMMSDKNLVNQLVANVAQQTFGGKEPGSSKCVSGSSKALVYIEEPSMAYLDQASGINVPKTKVKVQKAINKRTKKFMKSNWHSAIGRDT